MHAADVGAPANSERGRRERILIVEDGLVTRALAQVLLERADYAVDVAEDGAEALDAVCRGGQAYDLLLMDLDMPVMDGFAAAEAIRALPGERGDVPILAFAALAKPETITLAMASGMDGHLVKPFNPAEFSSAVRHCIDDVSASRVKRRAAAASPVWNPLVFSELAKRLAPAKTELAISLFEQCIQRARANLRPRGTSADAMAFEAHNLISAAGMMGFEDLCVVAQRAQTELRCGEHGVDSTECDRIRGNLLDAIVRALDSLRREFPADRIGISHIA